MSSTTVERTTDHSGHPRRAAPSQALPRVGPQPHAPGSRPRESSQRTDTRLSVTRAAVFQERARIGRELHDSVSQTLYAIILGASRARRLLAQSDSTELQRIIDDVLQLANAGQTEVRALLTDIHADGLTSAGLVTALEELAANMRTRAGLCIRLSVAEEPDVPASTKEALAMIAREALYNIVRHAAARYVDITLECDANHLVLMVSDDGSGFDAEARRPGHFGLHTMRQRASAIGGTLAVTSALARGTQVRVTIPV